MKRIYFLTRQVLSLPRSTFALRKNTNSNHHNKLKPIDISSEIYWFYLSKVARGFFKNK